MNPYPFRSIYNLIAIDVEGNALFGRNAANKQLARRELLLSQYVLKIDKVIFKSKTYSMKEVYKWI